MTNTQPHMITLIAAADRVCSAAQDGRGTSEASVQTVRVARGKRAGSNEGVDTKGGRLRQEPKALPRQQRFNQVRSEESWRLSHGRGTSEASSTQVVSPEANELGATRE